jgi:hypothetical protein
MDALARPLCLREYDNFAQNKHISNVKSSHSLRIVCIVPLNIVSNYIGSDRLCGLVARVPGYRSKMYCVSCEVRNICYVEGSRPPLWSSGESSWLHSGDVLCFLWGTNWIYICYVEESPSIRKSWQSLRRQAAVARSVQFARGLRPRSKNKKM